MAEMFIVLLSLFADTSRTYDWEKEQHGGLFDQSVHIVANDPHGLVAEIWEDWEGWIIAGQHVHPQTHDPAARPPKLTISARSFDTRCGPPAVTGCVDGSGIVLRVNDWRTLLHETAHALNNTHGRTGHGLDFRCIAVSLYIDYGPWHNKWQTHPGLDMLKEFCDAAELHGIAEQRGY